MRKNISLILRTVSVGLVLCGTASMEATAQPGSGKPLKVFILAGQSNMQGKARVRTIERLALTDDSKPMYRELIGEDGQPKVVDGVRIAYFTSGRSGALENKGPLSPSFGKEADPGHTFGPEYTFGVYLQKALNEPFLIIKTAWGGKNLRQQFRPPSAGDFKTEKDKHGNPTGHFYRLMVQHVQDVLKDPGAYHPAYDKEAGYEIAGFVWFQGFNDYISFDYPRQGRSKRAPRDFSEYTRLLSLFIKDVRKDFNAPDMPFVIGTLGVGGPSDNPEDNTYRFRNAQMAVAELPEFRGNVLGVRTENFRDKEDDRIRQKLRAEAERRVLADRPDIGGRSKQRATDAMAEEIKSEFLTPEEVRLMDLAQSDAGYHYNGSAYIMGLIGKAFAEAMVKLGSR